MIRIALYLVLFIFITPALSQAGAVLKVGPGMEFIAPSVAAQFARDGDTIEISAKGVYDNDVAVWSQNNLTIRGVDGRPHLKVKNKAAEGKAIWVIKGDNVLVENVEFSGAQVADKNGAGIRAEGKHLTVIKCYFHHNENGILSGKNPDSKIVIENSEFAFNGAGDGLSHNLYIGEIDTLVFRFNYSHHANVGHNLKTRAAKNIIIANRIMDEENGNASYAVDFSNGGIAYMIGNSIQQGTRTENSTMIAFGLEESEGKNNALYLINNTLVNDRHAGVFIKSKPGDDAVTAVNNIFTGKGDLPGNTQHWMANLLPKKNPLFVAREDFNYALTKESPAINNATMTFFSTHKPTIADLDLFPGFEYQHPATAIRREVSGTLDIGAFEYR